MVAYLFVLAAFITINAHGTVSEYLSQSHDATIDQMARDLAPATEGCGVVLYTTVFYSSNIRLPDPRPKCPWKDLRASNPLSTLGRLCCVLVIGKETVDSFSTSEFHPWRLVVMNTSTVGGNARRQSRLIKLLPHLVFLSTPITVFMDWKLQLLQDPRQIIGATLLQQEVGFVAFRHPCTTAYSEYQLCRIRKRDSVTPWLFLEGGLIKSKGVSHNITQLTLQLERYRKLGLDFREYIDGAILIRDARHAASRQLNCAWWAEYTRPDSSDRDQLSMSFVLATNPEFANHSLVITDPPQWVPMDTSTKRGGLLILSEGRGRSCGKLCHWYDGRSVGKIVLKTCPSNPGSGASGC